MHRLIASYIALSLMSSIVLAAEPCASDFDSFLLKFESAQEFQRQNTRFPLSATYVDGSAEPEPKTVTYKIRSASDPKYSRVDYPSKTKQATIPFEKSVGSKQGRVLVQFTKPDTDYSFAFSFERTSSCWRLVKFEDYSL
jgi:hypothetical protein